MNNLLEEFNNMERIPIMELEVEQEGYLIVYVTADEEGIYGDFEKVEWDEIFTLDEHLQTLHEKIIESYC